MNIKFKGLALGVALSAFAFSACESTSNTNVNVNTKANGNTAVVVPANNANTTAVNANTRSSANTWNGNITREEWEKNKDEYANRAKAAGDTVGQGAQDAWLWTKTRAALMTTDDLRDSTINVDVDNAVVTLKGTVANAAQKAKAEQVAKGVKDVKSVKNELKVAAGDSMTNTGAGNSASKNANANKK